jgi:hypothetical protein
MDCRILDWIFFISTSKHAHALLLLRVLINLKYNVNNEILKYKQSQTKIVTLKRSMVKMY